MIIGKYIRQLLNDSKRVVFPGFGNLEVKEVKGAVSQTGGKINPPGLTVKFDSGFSKDDGLLAATMVYGEGMKQEDADQRVLELIDAIKFALDKGEPFMLHQTGTFLKDDNGKVHFQTVSDWVLEPDHYGLESLDLLELEELPKEETSRETHIAEKAPPVAPVKAHEPRPSGRRGRINKRWKAIYIVTGTLIVILVALIFIPKKRPPIEAIQQNGQHQEENTAEETVPGSQENQPQPVEAQPEEQEPDPVVATPNFYIIAGSFKHLQNASEMQDQLKARGYMSEILITENRMYRVTVASYTTEAEAENVLSGLNSEPGLNSAWILSN
jgi:nucleoid DNA-binding protein/cell division septation protein DedD